MFRPTNFVLKPAPYLALVLLLGGNELAHANDAYVKFDTENLFGFLTGTDIGDVGEKEVESTTDKRSGKRTGSYNALSQTLALEYTPSENLRLDFGATAAYYDLYGVTGFDGFRGARFQGLSLEMRYRFLARERSLFGLAIQAEPHWTRNDETSGQPEDQYSVDLGLLIDKELIPNRVIGAFNISYSPEVGRSRLTGEWSRNAVYGVGASVMTQIWPGLFAGGEARYMRSYESLGRDGFAGQALFIGPNVFFKVAERWRVTATWAVQVAGQAQVEPGSLDLNNFERHQIKLRIGHAF